MPLVLNYKKLLFEDKKQVFLDFSKVKLCRFTPDEEHPQVKSEPYLILRALVNYCDTNVSYSVEGKFTNVNKLSLQDIKVACEAAKIKSKNED